MPGDTFDRHLQWLQDDVLVLASMVGSAIIESVERLRQGDVQGARWLVAADRFINEKRFAIEKGALGLIATQQPMAVDLRVLASVLEIATELERMGDCAKGIALVCLMINGQPLIEPLVDIPLMASTARQMLHEAVDAFSLRDAESARTIPACDVEVDRLYSQILRELLAPILASPRTLDQATYLLWVATTSSARRIAWSTSVGQSCSLSRGRWWRWQSARSLASKESPSQRSQPAVRVQQVAVAAQRSTHAKRVFAPRARYSKKPDWFAQWEVVLV